MDIKIFGKPDPKSMEQLNRCMVHADYGVLCADHHVGYSQPIGTAIAYDGYISPSGVGYDIGCGNKAVMTDLKVTDIDISQVLDEIVDKVSFGIGRKRKEKIDHPVLDRISNAPFKPQRTLLDMAREQLGTVGSGNHFIDLFSDEKDKLWIGVHFGSRGFGFKTTTGFLAISQNRDFRDKIKNVRMYSPPILFKVNTQLAQDYIHSMQLAGEYAYAGRDVVVDLVVRVLKCKALEVVHNHHNFAWLENHFGKDYWVVRKGCTPAFPSQKCFVGASMTGTSVILEGVDSKDSKEALYTTIHGAGRVMSRTQAAGVFRRRKGRKVQIKRGQVDFKKVKETMKEKGIVLRGGGADEAPEVYKDLKEVLEYHKGTVKIQHRLNPVGVIMAGSDILAGQKLTVHKIKNKYRDTIIQI